MGLNKQKGNMYEFITHTWNPIKGECPHNCEYCYMKKWGKQKPARLDLKEFKTDLGKGNFIFVGSSIDIFAAKIPKEWTKKTIDYLYKFPKNKYLLQTKNPFAFLAYKLPKNFILGTTIETNRVYKEMGNTPNPFQRAVALSALKNKTFITIEPVMDFDLGPFYMIIENSKSSFINIGAVTGSKKLQEPSKEKLNLLIEKITGKKITLKNNLNRIIK